MTRGVYVDNKKLEFVALLLSRDENILFYDKESVRKKTKAALLVYDAVMEEIGDKAEERDGRYCYTCKYEEEDVAAERCRSCLKQNQIRPYWEPKDE